MRLWGGGARMNTDGAEFCAFVGQPGHSLVQKKKKKKGGLAKDGKMG